MNKEILIIGGGPGGYVAAIRAAQLGAKVTLIEKDKVGGTCLNYGCVPTKTLNRSAEILSLIEQSEKLGIEVQNYSFDISKIQSHKNKVIKQLASGIEKLLSANGVELIYGEASFIDNHIVKVVTLDQGEKQIESENIIIATGSTTQMPPVEGIYEEGIYNSREMLDFKDVSESLVIIGGGVIGMEFACIFQSLGSKVIIMEYEKNILPMLDPDLSKRLVTSLKKKGMEFYTRTKVSKIKRENGKLTVLAESKKGEITIIADKILAATGRKPVFQGLNLENTEIQHNPKGIPVNEYFQTNIERVYAIGDVNGKVLLAHAASHQAISAVESIMGKENLSNQKLVPNCIFTLPEIATVGITETMAKEKNIPYKTSKFPFAANAKALSMGEEEGFVKIIADKNDKLLGMQVMGPHASDLIHEGTLAIQHNMMVEDIAHTIHAHPTLSEAFWEATLGIRGESIHSMPLKKRR